jgi:hypothetical protein
MAQGVTFSRHFRPFTETHRTHVFHFIGRTPCSYFSARGPPAAIGKVSRNDEGCPAPQVLLRGVPRLIVDALAAIAAAIVVAGAEGAALDGAGDRARAGSRANIRVWRG